MTMLPPCPLPQVDDALRPYIHARQETLRIRKALAEHLQAQIHRQQQQQLLLHQPQQGAESPTSITPLTLACAPPSLLPEDPFSSSTPPPPPPELTGLRKRYWEAVQAHALAKRRRDALHGELDELRRESHIRGAAAKAGGYLDTEPHNSFPPSAAAALPDGISSSDVQNYIALLHQRRRHAKLQILLDALDRIADAAGDGDAQQPNPLQRDVRQWVKEKLGDAPVPPPEIAGGGGGGGGDAAAIAAAEDAVKDHVLRLKKELLLAKQSLDAEMARRSRAADAALPEPGSVGKASAVEALVTALRTARDELIAWIEGELAKMADESLLSIGAGTGATPQRPSEQPGSTDSNDDDDDNDDVPIQDQVEALYARYVDARAALVDAVDAATVAAKDIGAASSSTLPASSAPPDQPRPQTQKTALPPSAVLPFIPALLHAAADERLLVQQSTYLRHRIAAAQEDARGTMDRLASESHLVAPGDAEEAGMMAWARAARGQAKEAEGAVGALLEEGMARVEGARGLLGELEKRREGFGGLKGEV